MMPGEDQVRVDPPTQLVEPGIARLACRGLSRFGAECELDGMTRKAELRGVRSHPPADRGAVAVNAMVDMGHHEIEALAGGMVQEVEENDGVEPAGHGDKRPSAWERERPEVRPELVV